MTNPTTQRPIIMPNPTTHSHFGIYGYVKKDDSILLIKKARGPYKGMYDLPGGSPEENETNEETFIRELKEETGLDVISHRKLTDQVTTKFFRYSVDGEDFLLKHSALFYAAEHYQGNIKTGSDGEDSDGAKWVKIADLHKIKSTPFVDVMVSEFSSQKESSISDGTISESKQNSRGLESSSITLFPSTTPNHEGVFEQSLLSARVSKIGRISINNNRRQFDFAQPKLIILSLPFAYLARFLAKKFGNSRASLPQSKPDDFQTEIPNPQNFFGSLQQNHISGDYEQSDGQTPSPSPSKADTKKLIDNQSGLFGRDD